MKKSYMFVYMLQFHVLCDYFIHSFIHSGHFYSAPSNPLLLRGAPDYSTDTVSAMERLENLSDEVTEGRVMLGYKRNGLNEVDITPPLSCSLTVPVPSLEKGGGRH